MKRVKLFLTVIIPSFSFIQLAKAQGAVENFVKLNDNLACRMMIDLYDPGSEFIRVDVEVSKHLPNHNYDQTWVERRHNLVVRNHYQDSLENVARIGTDNGILSVSLFWGKDHFYDISCYKHDEVKVSAEKLKALVNNLTKDFKKDEIAFVKKKWGKNLHELNIKELYCAVFTIRYWRMDYHVYSYR